MKTNHRILSVLAAMALAMTPPAAMAQTGLADEDAIVAEAAATETEDEIVAYSDTTSSTVLPGDTIVAGRTTVYSQDISFTDFIKEILSDDEARTPLIWLMVWTGVILFVICGLPLLLFLIIIWLLVRNSRRRRQEADDELLNSSPADSATLANGNFEPTENIEMKKQLKRSKDRIIAGVCGGLANYFGWDATLVRIVYALLTFLTAFSGIVIYIILWIVMPPKR